MKHYTSESKSSRIDHPQTLTEGHVKPHYPRNEISVYIITTVWVKPICMLARTQNESRPHRRQIRSPPPIQKNMAFQNHDRVLHFVKLFVSIKSKNLQPPTPKHKRGSSYPYNLLKSGIYYQTRRSGSHATMKNGLKKKKTYILCSYNEKDIMSQGER